MLTLEAGPLSFLSDFDSGNLLKVELSDSSASAPNTSRPCDYEVNVWTKPDCYGTKYENGNRTWFYFGVKGGKPHATLKLNVLNLNKQIKLFVQGMQPVFRVVPGLSTWERIRDKLVLNETGEHVCSISFRHKLPQDPENSCLLFAFTFPYSCSDVLELLDSLDNQFLHNKAVGNPTTSARFIRSMENDIYYHRECVCLSLEGRRVELLTVTSIFGKSTDKEDNLMNLYPVPTEERAFKFPEKKVVFLSARVHPGETPSSFVLNGFLKFILNASDVRAACLRRLFVFKFIPVLNPDGVVRGHYRTDPRGVNLNRVYLRPSPILHPPIYAARKLLLYYHNGFDTPDDYEYPTETDNEANESDPEDEESKMRKNCDISSQPSCSGDTAGLSMKSESNDVEVHPKSHSLRKRKKSYTFVLSKANSLCAGCGPFVDVDKEIGIEALDTTPSEMCQTSSSSLPSSTDAKHQCSFESCDDDSVFYDTLQFQNISSTSSRTSMNFDLPKEDNSNLVLIKGSGSNLTAAKQQLSGSGSKQRVTEKKRTSKRGRKKKSGARSNKKEGNSSSKIPSLGLQANSTSIAKGGSKKFLNESTASFLKGQRNQSGFPNSSSGLALYLDCHGHTSKRGIFMYGNHFPDAETQAECMLLPRLMAINCQHFDFSACNFTERLMCMKDRRDGASREGSGRVACLKLTGLIRSYTLECNYNTGRMINHIVSRPLSLGFSDGLPVYYHQSPVFNPAIFEGAGAAVAESLLDLTGHNTWSRLNYTEFKNLEGIRRNLLRRLKASPEYKSPRELNLTKPSVASTESKIPFVTKKNGKAKGKSVPISSPLSGGPLGPRRENNNSVSSSPAKASGSRTKKSSMSCDSTCASAMGDAPSKSTKVNVKVKTKAKSGLSKSLKVKKTFPKFSTRKSKRSVSNS